MHRVVGDVEVVVAELVGAPPIVVAFSVRGFRTIQATGEPAKDSPLLKAKVRDTDTGKRKDEPAKLPTFLTSVSEETVVIIAGTP